jgi:hypothetical protein
MFDISIFLNWRSTRWNILKMFSSRFSENWAWEFNLYATHSWFLLDTHLITHGDHRGFFLMIGLLGYALDINIYDVRHGEEK